MGLIQAAHIIFSYRGTAVLNNVSLAIRAGEVVSLLGPNGCGKTTLLKILLGLLPPQNGKVLFHGKDVATMSARELAGKMAYVPQTHRIGFAYRVLDVVLMGRTPHKRFFSDYSKQDVEIALHCLERLSIADLSERPYNEISGGERQLTLIARALAQGARTLIMDEPASGLDYGNQIRLLTRISDLSHDGYTFIKSTHAPDHALWIANRVLIMKGGSIIADGKPQDVINGEAISRLYSTQVGIVSVSDTLRMCVPHAMMNGWRRTVAQEGIAPPEGASGNSVR